MSAARVMCLGCGHVGRWGSSGRCETCRIRTVRRIERDPARRSIKRARYDRQHRAERRAWAPLVATGTVRCGRCAEPIAIGEAWDLDHLEHLGISHPSHASHNRAATRRTKEPAS
jgi:hypothetical protein